MTAKFVQTYPLFGILNKVGDFWTHQVFTTHGAAEQHIDMFWHGNPKAPKLCEFAVVPVAMTMEIAPEPPTPDTIDWTTVAAGWKWMARDKYGNAMLFTSVPERDGDGWDGHGSGTAEANAFASYVSGTVDWKSSLVQRPEVTP